MTEANSTEVNQTNTTVITASIPTIEIIGRPFTDSFDVVFDVGTIGKVIVQPKTYVAPKPAKKPEHKDKKKEPAL